MNRQICLVYKMISLCLDALANKRCQDFYVTSPMQYKFDQEFWKLNRWLSSNHSDPRQAITSHFESQIVTHCSSLLRFKKYIFIRFFHHLHSSLSFRCVKWIKNKRFFFHNGNRRRKWTGRQWVGERLLFLPSQCILSSWLRQSYFIFFVICCCVCKHDIRWIMYRRFFFFSFLSITFDAIRHYFYLYKRK
jgi:hypothetical protein